MKRAKFHARGVVVTRKLVEKIPEMREGEKPEAYANRVAFLEAIAHVEGDFLRLSRERVVALRHERTLLKITDAARREKLEAEGKPAAIMTAEGETELRAHQRKVVVEVVQGVRGMDLGDLESDGLKGEELAQFIDDCGLLADFDGISFAVQDPTPEQLER